MIKKLILVLLLFLGCLNVGFSPDCELIGTCEDEGDLANQVQENKDLMKDKEVRDKLSDEQIEEIVRRDPGIVTDIPVEEVNDRGDSIVEVAVDAAVTVAGGDKDVVEAEEGLKLKDIDTESGTVTLDGGDTSLEFPVDDLATLSNGGLIDEGEVIFGANGEVTLDESIVISGSEGEETKILGMQENKETGKIEVYMEGGGNVVIIGDEPSKYVFITGEDSTILKGETKHTCVQGCKTAVEEGKLVITGNNVETVNYLTAPEQVFVSDGTVVSDFGSLNPQSGAIVTEYEEAIIGDSSSRKAIVTYNVPENTPELKIMYDYPGLDSDDGNWVYNDRDGDAFYGKFDESINLGFHNDAPTKIDLHTQRLKDNNRVVIGANLNEEFKTKSYLVVDPNNDVFGSDPTNGFKNSDIEVSQLNSEGWPEIFEVDHSMFGTTEMNLVQSVWKCSTVEEGGSCQIGRSSYFKKVKEDGSISWVSTVDGTEFVEDGPNAGGRVIDGVFVDKNGNSCPDPSRACSFSSNKDYFDIPNSKGEYVFPERKVAFLIGKSEGDLISIGGSSYKLGSCPKGSGASSCAIYGEGDKIEFYSLDEESAGRHYNEDGDWVDQYTGASCSEGTNNAACFSSNRNVFPGEPGAIMEYVTAEQGTSSALGGVKMFDELALGYEGETYQYMFSEAVPYCSTVADDGSCNIAGKSYPKSNCGGVTCFSWTGDNEHFNLLGALVDSDTGKFIDRNGNSCEEACAWSSSKNIFEATVQKGVVLTPLEGETDSSGEPQILISDLAVNTDGELINIETGEIVSAYEASTIVMESNNPLTAMIDIGTARGAVTFTPTTTTKGTIYAPPSNSETAFGDPVPRVLEREIKDKVDIQKLLATTSGSLRYEIQNNLDQGFKPFIDPSTNEIKWEITLRTSFADYNSILSDCKSLGCRPPNPTEGNAIVAQAQYLVAPQNYKPELHSSITEEQMTAQYEAGLAGIGFDDSSSVSWGGFKFPCGTSGSLIKQCGGTPKSFGAQIQNGQSAWHDKQYEDYFLGSKGIKETSKPIYYTDNLKDNS